MRILIVTAVMAFIWTGGPASAELYSLTDPGTFGRPNSVAYDINDAGQVVGYVENSVTQGFVYSNGTMTSLGALGGEASIAYGINEAGQVVGAAYTENNLTYEAFLYSNGMMMGLGTLGGSSSVAYDINNAGQVVGNAAEQAFLYSNGMMMDLGALRGGTGINKAGQVVGYSYTINNVDQLASLYSNGTMTGLGTLDGKTFSFANGINDSRQVVGYAGGGGGLDHAFLYSNGSMVDLNSLLDASGNGWTLQQATAINSKGQIVGFGIDPLGHMGAFVLTPVPLPPAVVLFGSGFLGLLALLGWRARTT